MWTAPSWLAAFVAPLRCAWTGARPSAGACVVRAQCSDAVETRAWRGTGLADRPSAELLARLQLAQASSTATSLTDHFGAGCCGHRHLRPFLLGELCDRFCRAGQRGCEEPAGPALPEDVLLQLLQHCGCGPISQGGGLPSTALALLSAHLSQAGKQAFPVDTIASKLSV